MTQNEKLGFEHKGIGELLAHNRMVVPLNQREYSWKDEHVHDLFTDFSNAIAKNKAAYFLGTIVLTKGSSDLPEVSDGQQRLATTSIMLASIRDYFHRANDLKRAMAISQKYLSTTDLATTETVPKLHLNVDDNEFFRKYVIAEIGSEDRKVVPTKRSHERIKVAAGIASVHIKSILQSHAPENHAARLIELANFIDSGAQVIVLRVPDHLNAFIMFETLNDRGLKASQADLLKNHLLHQCGERIAEGQQKWAQMMGVLESIGEGDITVTYLHHLLILKNGPTREREVFDSIKQTVNSQLRAIEFLTELADGANDYAALFNPDHKKWNEYGTSTRKSISTINRDLRVEQIRPLMFAVARRFSATEAKIAFRQFVSWSVRFMLVGGRGGLLDRHYSLRANEVVKGEIKTAAELTSALTDILPSNAQFEAEFATANISKSYIARYLLRAMELCAKKDPEPEFIPTDEETVINLEHVLPEKPGDGWSKISADEASALYSRIGNLVLLQVTQNSKIGNGSFQDKKETLEKSAFLLTVMAGKCTAWTATDIAARQKELAKIAVKTWPLKL